MFDSRAIIMTVLPFGKYLMKSKTTGQNKGPADGSGLLYYLGCDDNDDKNQLQEITHPG